LIQTFGKQGGMITPALFIEAVKNARAAGLLMCDFY
jgi:hypothetical protein